MQSEILIKHLIYFVSITLILALSFFVYLKGRKEKPNRFFFISSIFAVFWLISLFSFYNLESPKLILWLGRFNFAIVLPMVYYLFEFAVAFPRQIFKLPTILKIIFQAWTFLFTFLTLFTSWVSKNETIIGIGQRKTIFGPLFPFYAFQFLFFTILILIILFYKLRNLESVIEKQQLKYILLGLSVALIFGFITNIFLYYLGMGEMANYGPLGTIVFFGFVSIAILKHYLFDIKVISAEVFTFFLVFVLFISIFTASTMIQKIINTFIFLGASLFGIYLIKSVINEIKVREQIQQLNIELQKAYEELKVLDDAKSEFISMASHQLRTPLTAIKGYLSMMIDGSWGKIPDQAKEKMENIFQSTERLIRIVADLLDVSKVDLGKMELEKEETDIKELVKSCYEELKITADKKGLNYTLDITPEPLPNLNIDSLKVRQVIMNLIDNSLKYTLKGEVKVKLEKKDNNVLISIKDTGDGLTEKEKKDIFEGFVRGSAGIDYFIEGAGLGLYVAKKFLDIQKGKIWAESEGKGKGSTFFVQLPIE